ncbi:MAG: M23 family metallopeptidase [Candidatus Moranbacteria bacterium]|nr:M23 family metallopeptidase [Candidatus Moranbacteria bacterium]
MKKLIATLVFFVLFGFKSASADFTGSPRPPMPTGSDGFTHYISASGIEYVYFFNTQEDYQYFVDQGHAGTLHVFANNNGPALWYYHARKVYELVSGNWEERSQTFYPNDADHMLDSSKTLPEQICSTTDLRAGYNQYFPGYYGFSVNPAYAEVVMTANCSYTPPAPSYHFPLNGSMENSTILLGFGDDWVASCDGQVMKHTGIDIAANEYETVYAAESGIVKVAQINEDYGGWVTLEHNNGSYTTTYWHIIPSVSVNDMVSRGDPIGEVTDYGATVHLHFGLRTGAYSNTSNRGRLPQSTCGGDPSFPENFVDPETLSFE